MRVRDTMRRWSARADYQRHGAPLYYERPRGPARRRRLGSEWGTPVMLFLAIAIGLIWAACSPWVNP